VSGSDRIEVWAPGDIGEVLDGDDLAGLVAAAAPDLADGDVVVVTSKIVSKAEGRVVPGARDDHLAAETRRVVARRGPTAIVETHHGFVLAAAGIDASNVAAGTVVLLPVDPDASARRIRDGLAARLGVDVGVVVSDTLGRPWRNGVTDVALGAAGLEVLADLRGERDVAGNVLEATVVAVADELASAADLVKGKLAGTPVAVIRGLDVRPPRPDHGARPIVRDAADDMFRLGTAEAMTSVVAGSAPVREADDVPSGPVDPQRLARAVAAVDDGRLVVAGGVVSVLPGGDELSAGVLVGRLLTALAAEGLRGQWPVDAPGDGLTAVRALPGGSPAADVADR
jgi:coenzyme F420-0:L-glutamate ligase / coenzyme F420-1:gamma-L-glutamate ligase